MKNTKTASLEDIRAMHARGEVKAPRADASELDMPEGFWDTATPQAPKTKQQVNMRVDPDILEFFKGQGNGHLTRMHAVLRSYVDAQKNRNAS
ncbi:BrnA antitoxin family protein [Pseudosulfitobacter sp. SM2401]|uniref:BrnA antitoxin family protein n=1 Tax=Pseudosulfitobacter sp. SM2401 TaxID=3350098 RepID=UPI0036F3640D